MKPYVPLWCKSHFSLLEGASAPEELVTRAHELGLQALALTDRDSLAGAPRAAAHARKLGLKLLYGAEVRLTAQRRITLIAKDRLGYGNLTQLLSRAPSQEASSALTMDDLYRAAQGCFALIGGADGWFGAEPEVCSRTVDQLKASFADRLFVRISDHRYPAEVQQRRLLAARAQAFQLPLVAANEHLYHHPSRRRLCDILSCTRFNSTLDDAGLNLRRNADHALASPETFAARFQGKPEWIERSFAIAQACSFDLFALRYRYPCERLPQGVRGIDHLAHLAQVGGQKRYRGPVPDAVQAQLAKELELVQELDYTGYFLTMHDIVQFCQAQGILCQGRGSAANSALCYCLEITAVDPMKHQLLFERFLSRERSEPPDIDLDIAHERREEVIQYVYSKYGRRHAAMVSVNIRYRAKSALNDAGKALKIDIKDIKKVTKLTHRSLRTLSPDLLETAGLDPAQPTYQTWIEIAEQMLGTPRHRSTHPGGFLLGHEPIDTFVPVLPAAMPGRTVIQWDKEDVETLSLFKVDLLGLGMLSQLQRCFELLRRHPPPSMVALRDASDHDLLARIPADDEATYTMLSCGDSLGVFQVESRAQMNMLPRLRPQRFYDLVVQIAIVRPGPISGDMVHPYLRRRNGEEAVVYPHPSLEPILERTLGVPLFQEQVMRIAMVAADYTPGEADQLRRDMGAWKQTGRMEGHEHRLIERMKSKGISEQFAERVYEQIKGFGEYGFPESHAASFALISYATAFLKRHFPAHFYAALINAQPMGFYSVSTLVYGAQREGVTVLPIDVRFSTWESTLELAEGRLAIRMGFRSIKGLGSQQKSKLDPPPRPESNEALGVFARRLQLARPALEALAEAGAFHMFGSRRDVLWQIMEPGLVRHEPLMLAEHNASSSFAYLSELERIVWDQRRTAHSTRGHPFALLRRACDQKGFMSSSQLTRCRHQSRASCVGLVICRQRPSTASGVTFVTLEDEDGFVNLVIWKKVAERFQVTLKGASVLAASGRVQREQEITHLIVHRLWIPELDAAIEPVASHDYR
ncbi:MAG: error-prone DNA polymerase [Myxococcota bacterium]|nr:error-prone DNA polymerase [Myxococcota bacterium]